MYLQEYNITTKSHVQASTEMTEQLLKVSCYP